MAKHRSIISDHLDAQKERAKAFARLLYDSGDLVSTILRGHLIVEELLFSYVSIHCEDVAHLKNARLRFPQLVAMVRALERLPTMTEEVWTAVMELNALRNVLSHQLEPIDLTERLNKFVARIEGLLDPGTWSKSTDATERFRWAVGVLSGMLSASTSINLGVKRILSKQQSKLKRAASSKKRGSTARSR